MIQRGDNYERARCIRTHEHIILCVRARLHTRNLITSTSHRTRYSLDAEFLPKRIAQYHDDTFSQKTYDPFIDHIEILPNSCDITSHDNITFLHHNPASGVVTEPTLNRLLPPYPRPTSRPLTTPLSPDGHRTPTTRCDRRSYAEA